MGQYYANDTRVMVLMSRGIANSDALDKPDNIDEVILGIVSGINLPKAEKIAFSLAFKDSESWKEVASRYNTQLNRNASTKTVRDHAMRAQSKIRKTVSDDEKLMGLGEELYQKAQRLYETYKKTHK
ncbi:hypothetical protein HYS31_08295 [Candidatus Woesearchaeota archaeon]|nr:hypothetical protein [Candidatus Woesearchaeota archaeon]